MRKLTNEMVRVCAKNGNAVIVTHGPPAKRMDDLNSYECRKQVDLYSQKISLSDLAQLINLLRTDLQDKPLSYAFKSKDCVKNAMKELFLIKKEEELLISKNPKHKMIGLMLKARRTKQEQEKNEENKVAAEARVGTSKAPADYVPQRQGHCYIYVLKKK